MQNSFVADTMALILFLEERKLPKRVKEVFKLAEDNKAKIYVPAIVLAEIGYLSEKGKIDINLSFVKDYFNRNKSIIVKDLSFDLIEISFRITDIPELHDRLIAGTGLSLNIPIISNDDKILKSGFVNGFWE